MEPASGEKPAEQPDPGATRLMELLRNGNESELRKALAKEATSANRKGPARSTPLMYAVLYGAAGSVRDLLDKGADPNLRNDAGASAIMWAVGDLAKTRLLIERGADVNVRSDGGRTPLMMAAGRFGSGAVVKLLLDHGANPNVKSPGLFGPITALSEVASTADDSVMRMLIGRGADIKQTGFLPLFLSVQTNCMKCMELVLPAASSEILNMTAVFLSPPFGDAHAVPLLLEHGANVNSKDPGGNTLLMLASSSEVLPLDTVKALIARGADINAKNLSGETALDIARKLGRTPIVELLGQAGATDSASLVSPPKSQPANSVREAVQKTLPLLQQNDAMFLRKAGCVSCHNNALTAMTIAVARKNGFAADDSMAQKQVKTIIAYLDSWRERMLQGLGIPGDADTISYILLGMAAQNYAPDLATDAMAIYLKNKQLPNGQWAILGHRPPLESSNIEVTAASMHALQTYAPKALRAEFDTAIRLASSWLLRAQPKTTEDRVFQILGLSWSVADRGVIRKAVQDLIAAQRPDGGWAQIPTLTSDAYATGQSLVALRESGVIATNAAAYRRGIEFLLKTQLDDGSWYVKSRAMPIQPYFESGFPHGHDQWISASATNWASMALAQASATAPAVPAAN